MLTEILLNKWFLTFVIGWIVFFLLIDWKKFYLNIWGGIIACILQLIHDTESTGLNLYKVCDAGIWILTSSVFFTFGVVFTMGVIFLQFIPQNTILKIIHLFTFVIGFLIFEYIAVSNGMLKYIHYSGWLSLQDNLMVMATLAWIKSFVLFLYNVTERKS